MTHISIREHSNNLDGRLSAVSRSRIELATSILEDFKAENDPACLLATGRFGDKFSRPKTPQHVRVEEEIKRLGFCSDLLSGAALNSSHTVEDVILIKNCRLFNDVHSFLVVTSEFHLARIELGLGAIFNSSTVTILAAENPSDIRDQGFAHERAANRRLVAQRGVVWDNACYPLTSITK